MNHSRHIARLAPLSMTAMTIAVLAACSSVPASNPTLDNARSSLREAQDSADTREFAGAELAQAADALSLADAAFARREGSSEVDHLAYVARQRVYVAQEVASRKNAERMQAAATAESTRVRLDARTRQADAAERSAGLAQRDAARSQRTAESAQRDAQAAQLQSAAAQQQSAAAQQQSESAQQRSLDAEARSAALEALLIELDARKTDRGMVITMGDVLFDTSQSSLKPAGMRNMDRLVSLMRQYPARRVVIEGFTDSVGSDSSNRDLSERRAQAVRAALMDQGIGADRVATHAFGELHPVASNSSADGRQLNRRVEIVLSDEMGRVVPR